MAPATFPRLDDSEAWAALHRHAAAFGDLHLADLAAADPRRARDLTVDAGAWHLNYARNLLTSQTIGLLTSLADEARLRHRIEAVFAGEKVNTTEHRPALHSALRLPRAARLIIDGRDVVADVHHVLDQMATFAQRVRTGQWTGATGNAITDVVNIGIGGSHLGPAMAAAALRPHLDGPTLHFVSNIDGADLIGTLDELDASSTLFVVSSKTFTTLETMTNANSARTWLIDALGADAVAHHFVAVSTNLEAVSSFGISPDAAFGFWDWVGGRYSLDSAIGLSLMCGLGPEGFLSMLSGMHEIDEHVRRAPWEQNLPVMLALVGIWNHNFRGHQSVAVLPYAADLSLLPAFLQQLDMESNGKSVTTAGEPVGWSTGPVIWGQPGTDGQHAFFQLLHQGTQVVPCEFIGFCRSIDGPADHHDLLMANLLAQSEALATGRGHEDPHRRFEGNRPSSTLLGTELSPEVLGQLVAIYEHKVVAQGLLWQVNSFDQWGVELGKELATTLSEGLTGRTTATMVDPTTAALAQHYLDHN